MRIAFWSALQETDVSTSTENDETDTEPKPDVEEKKAKDAVLPNASKQNDTEEETPDPTQDSEVSDRVKDIVTATEDKPPGLNPECSSENVTTCDESESDIPLHKMTVDTEEGGSGCTDTASDEGMEVADNLSSEVREACGEDNCDVTDKVNSPKVLTSAELVSLLRNIHKGPTVLENVTTIGMVRMNIYIFFSVFMGAILHFIIILQ